MFKLKHKCKRLFAGNLFILQLILVTFFIPVSGLKLDRVILATDANPMYLEFWPIAAKVWRQVTGLRPTLALIADSSVTVDETLGDVIRFEPIPGISTALQAQVIRLLLPAFFPDDGCILSDIDMIPLQKNYFINHAINVPDDFFIIYRNRAYNDQDNHYPICYNAAKGRVFADVFGITGITSTELRASIRAKIAQWANLNHGWHTDELYLTQGIQNWQHYQTHVIKLNHDTGPRIDRNRWGYDINFFKAGIYLDAHLLRPYAKHKSEIDRLVHLLKIK